VNKDWTKKWHFIRNPMKKIRSGTNGSTV